MANHFYAYISRMRCVKRWALMRNTEEENIQEHSHMVAVLAHALALIRTRVFGLPTDANAVAVAALYHDATEILTGDMPTPIKYYNPEIRDAYRKVEAVASDKLLSMLPDDAQWVYLYLCPGTTIVITDELERDEELRARLLPKETPTPDCYMIQGEE